MKAIQYNIGILGTNGISYLKSLPSKVLPSGQTKRWGLFKCSCGKEFEGMVRPIAKGVTKDCGCGIISNYQRHTLTDTPVRRCWSHIKTRCFNPKGQKYSYYGGRGITLYTPWINNFMAFYKYVSKLPHYGEPNRSLDRIDNDGDYWPGNLRWATKSEQMKNRRNWINKVKV